MKRICLFIKANLLSIQKTNKYKVTYKYAPQIGNFPGLGSFYFCPFSLGLKKIHIFVSFPRRLGVGADIYMKGVY